MSKLRRNRLTAAVHLSLLLALPGIAAAQDAPQEESTLDTISVTGSRIKQTNAVTAQPVYVLDRAKIEESGVASVGELLQQLTASGKALNAKFNSSGNFGYPPDGGGIGAGSAQVDLRNLGSQRVLVLVDGIRWVNESSASGVSGSADLNTIPLAIIERVEVLEDGASAIYGSDAIAGVVNIITRRDFKGAELHTYYGEYSRGGETTEASFTFGTGGDAWTAVLGASYYDQDRISSGDWGQSSQCQPGAGNGACSSGTPQGRFVFFDPTNTTFYNITLNPGTTTPVFVPGNPNGGTYNQFDASDRFNYAPFNLLLTPSERKSLFASVNIDLSDNTRLHFKGLFNNRQSANQAAPEPIFVGPGAGTGGFADLVSIPANHPFNPFGFALDASNNFVFIGRRPLEVGPRIFKQNVDTWYFNVGLDGLLDIGGRSYGWDANYVHTRNSATQRFTNGYNVARIRTALGDPAVCAATPGCVPLDIFGGQGRPFTRQMIDWITTDQRDASTQVLDIFSFNITGDLFAIGDRTAGFAAGAEYRRYKGDFDPDPLRQTRESQDSFAAPISASYDVTEVYGEFNFPVHATLDLTGALRWSDYSTFGSATTGKVGFRWQPIEDLVVRGTYSQGFRAPNLGELFGLTQFGATLVDPCGPTGAPVVDRTNGVSPGLEQACVNDGVPDNFEQANTQITTFTGGNPDLDPEESDSWTVGVVYSPGWGEDAAWSRKLDVELGYYSHEIEGAVQSRDLQTLLNACYNQGSGTDPRLCSPFTRQGNGNLNPPNNFLQNFGTVETSGADLKINWLSPEWGFGSLNASMQTTWVRDYTAVDGDGIVSSRRVGIEVNDSAIPEWQSNLQLGWSKGNFGLTYGMRYIDAVEEDCANAIVSTVPGCLNARGFNKLGSVTYHDVQFSWKSAFMLDGLKLSFGGNNVFGKEPPICVTCSLNGYDAGTYDLPGAFWYLSADYRF
jgi:iron complex outermembrane receptor protein